jgi:hypothetical protein
MGQLVVGHYPQSLARHHSLAQYFFGVYRTRVLGRELILGFGNLLTALGLHHGLLLAWAGVNGVALGTASFLLWRLTASRSDHFSALYVAGLCCLAVSGGVITPYDYLSYALILGMLMAASVKGRWGIMLTVALAATATATRESAFVGVAAIVVLHAGAPGGTSILAVRDWLQRAACPAVLAAIGAVTLTYAGLKIGLGIGQPVVLLEPVALRSNLSVSSGMEVLLAVAMVLVVRWATPRASATVGLSRERRTLWGLCAPYLAVVVVAGRWVETPRLVMPLILGECAISVRSLRPDASQIDGNHRLDRL